MWLGHEEEKTENSLRVKSYLLSYRCKDRQQQQQQQPQQEEKKDRK